MNIDVSYYTSLGGRQKNEDFVSIMENNNSIIASVADGLGGHDSGEVASQLAVKTINSELTNRELSIVTLEKAVSAANSAVLKEAGNSNMKTTIAVMWATKNKAIFATVGDTRIYYFKNNNIVFQSTDHSVSQMAVMAGEINNSQIRGHKDRNKLVRVLGYKENIKPDITDVQIEPRDAILICSDGFWENIIESEMCRVLSHSKDSKEWLTEMRAIIESVMPDDNDNNTAIAMIVNK